MLIDKNLLKSCFHNMLYLHEEDRGIKAERFTVNQQEYYATISYIGLEAEKPLMTSGITVEFETDAEEIALDYVIGGGYVDCGNERCSSFDVYVDGLMLHSHTEYILPDRVGTVRINLSGRRMRKIQIWLPSLYEAFVRSLTVSDGAQFHAIPGRPKKLLVCGDSITQGVGSHFASAGYAMRLARRMKDYEVLNHGIAAFMFDENSLDWAMDYQPDLIITAYGTNDWSKLASKQEFDRNLTAYIDRLCTIWPNIPVVMMSPLWRCDWNRYRYDKYDFYEVYPAMKKLVAGYTNVTVVNGVDLIPHAANVFLDGLHPNDYGGMLVGDALYRTLEERSLL